MRELIFLEVKNECYSKRRQWTAAHDLWGAEDLTFTVEPIKKTEYGKYLMDLAEEV